MPCATGSKPLGVSRAAGEKKDFIGAMRGFGREEGKGEEFGWSQCSGQYYFVLYFYNHQFSLQQRVINYSFL